MIIAEGIGFAYGRTPVLEGAFLEGRDGQMVGLVGPNGSGKTTFLRTLYGSLRPTAGLVTLDGDPVARLGPRRTARRVAVVAQERGGDLPVTVREMVLLGRLPHQGVFDRHSPDDHARAAAALARVGASHLADRRVDTLSGGEKQRVLIARSLTQDVRHLLLDEPTNHLDVRYQHDVLGLVAGLEVTTVVVLHDLNLAARYCDHVVLLDRGRVVASGSPGEVFTPATLEPVYGIGVTRVDVDGRLHLVFTPHDGPTKA
ncbi:ABC transporter ATP-binding protein [Nocardioides sp. DS6]|uniref:ABC transporter ATP-binding protein n=1 Tax=Nocardioides eburneus TaxID=3231482 RepID=A0ABV3SVL3_9ACTN